jgi:rhodanese-related sulfurtransferase
MSKETTDTLGHQKQVNYALNPNLTKEEFIKEILTGLTTPPGYFPQNVLMNIKGYESFDTVMQRGIQALSPNAFEAAATETDALVLDTRDAQVFSEGFIPNSVNIGIDGNFAQWVGALIPDVKQQILLVADKTREEEVITRLARVGYDHCIGYLEGGFEAWKNEQKEVDQIQRVTAEQLADIQKANPQVLVFDVRKNSEFMSEHILEVENAPLDTINTSMLQMPKDKTAYIHCAGGYRSMIFASILRARGYDNLVDVVGGFKAIKESGRFEVTDYVCPTTLL